MKNKLSRQGLSYLCLQDVRPDAEATGETRVVGAECFLLNLDGFHYEGVRSFELSLSEHECFKCSSTRRMPHPATFPQHFTMSNAIPHGQTKTPDEHQGTGLSPFVTGVIRR